MRLRVADRKEFCAGLIFAGIGLGALLLSSDYRLGTATVLYPPMQRRSMLPEAKLDDESGDG